jgi:hypothetical protein
MKKLPIAIIRCAIAAGALVASSLSAKAQTLELQLQADNYNPTTGVWTDSSGNGDTGTFGGSSTLPTLATGATPNGSSAVDISSASATGGSFLLNSSIPDVGGYTVFAYCEVSTDGAVRNALTGGSLPTALEWDVYNGNDDFLTEYTADVAHGNATLPTTSFSLIDLAVSSLSSFRLNGSSDGSGSGATFGQPITRIGNNEGGGDGFVGDIAEIDIYSGVLSGSQISSEEAALTAAYVTPTPEPTTMAIMAGGLGLLFATRGFRRHQA